MVNVTIHFSNGQRNSANGVEIEETMTALYVHESEGEYTAVPLANVLFYEVEPA